MRFPLRRILIGFTAGAAAGWVASLLRRPADAPAGTGADAAEHLPPDVAADPAEGHPPPRKAVPPSITPPPGSDLLGDPHDGATEPATPPEEGAEHIEPAKKPARKRARKAAPDPVAAVAEAVAEGRAQVDEHLASMEDAATPPKAPPRRRGRLAPEA